MQIQALWQAWWQQIERIDPFFVLEGGRSGLHSYHMCNAAGIFQTKSVLSCAWASFYTKQLLF